MADLENYKTNIERAFNKTNYETIEFFMPILLIEKTLKESIGNTPKMDSCNALSERISEYPKEIKNILFQSNEFTIINQLNTIELFEQGVEVIDINGKKVSYIEELLSLFFNDNFEKISIKELIDICIFYNDKYGHLEESILFYNNINKDTTLELDDFNMISFKRCPNYLNDLFLNKLCSQIILVDNKNNMNIEFYDPMGLINFNKNQLFKNGMININYSLIKKRYPDEDYRHNVSHVILTQTINYILKKENPIKIATVTLWDFRENEETLLKKYENLYVRAKIIEMEEVNDKIEKIFKLDNNNYLFKINTKKKPEKIEIVDISKWSFKERYDFIKTRENSNISLLKSKTKIFSNNINLYKKERESLKSNPVSIGNIENIKISEQILRFKNMKIISSKINEKIFKKDNKIKMLFKTKSSAIYSFNNVVYMEDTNQNKKTLGLVLFNIKKEKGYMKAEIIENGELYTDFWGLSDDVLKYGYIDLHNIFKPEEYIYFKYIKNLYGLKESKNSSTRFKIMKDILKKNNNFDFIKSDSFIKKIIKNKYDNLQIISQKIDLDFIKEKKPLENDFLKSKNELKLLIINKYQDKYSENIINIFLNGFIFSCVYNDFEIKKYKINEAIVTKVENYLSYISKIEKKLEESKIKNEDICSISYKDLMSFIEIENNLIEKFNNSLPKPFSIGLNKILEKANYDRKNDLYIFLEGYTSYIADKIMTIEMRKEILKFAEEKSITFGQWSRKIESIEYDNFAKKTFLDINTFEEIKSIFKSFAESRNKIKGHGCFYSNKKEDIFELEKLFFKKIRVLTELNNSIYEQRDNGSLLFYNKQDETIFTLKKINLKDEFKIFDFYNFSNQTNDLKDINKSSFLYNLKESKYIDFFLDKTKEKYNKNIKGNEIIDFTLNPDQNGSYKNDTITIIFEREIKDKTFLPPEYKTEGLKINIELEDGISIFDVHHENMISNKIRECITIVKMINNMF